MPFKQHYIEKFNTDRGLRLRWSVAIEVDPQTIDRRLGLRGEGKKNLKKLATPKSLAFLCKELKVKVTDLLEPENA